MPIDPGFQEDLERTMHGLESNQKQLKGLYGQAQIDKLPEPVQRLLQRKAGLLGHIKEDLEQIPVLVKEAEDKERQRKLGRSGASR